MNTTTKLKGAIALAGILGVAATACNPVPAKPKVSITDATVVEGTGGTSNLWFTLNLSRSSTSTVSLAWTAIDGTATQPADFAESRGTVGFTPGTTTAAVHVPLVTDAVDEVDETLRLVLFASTTADLADDSAVGTITDDDGAPTVTLEDAPAGAETDTGSWAGFPVRLSHASSRPVAVTCQTVDGTAKAGKDFPVQDPCGVTVPAGATRADIHIPRSDDVIDELDESYGLRLLGADGATIADGEASTTIFDTDATPTFTVDDVDVAEGNPDGPDSYARFIGRLSHPSSRTVTVGCEARSGTAVENDDFVDYGGACFSFPFEATTDEVAVPIWEDTKKEDDEDFFLDAYQWGGSAPVTLGDSVARAVLRNDGDSCRLFCD